MDQPRPCTYKKFDCDGKRVGDSIPIKAPMSTSTFSNNSVEHRDITLYQLMAIETNIDRKCEEEDCTKKVRETTPKTVTL